VHLPPFSRHLVPLRSKYSSQNPVLKHPQSLPLASETKFHTHTKHTHRSTYIYRNNPSIPNKICSHILSKLIVVFLCSFETKIKFWMSVTTRHQNQKTTLIFSPPWEDEATVSHILHTG
jgi:hypothetical protein